MKDYSFCKLVRRNDFTSVFGGIGKRRILLFLHFRKQKLYKSRTKMQMIRRAHQGYRNRIFGTIQALKLRIKYNRRAVIPQFRR